MICADHQRLVASQVQKGPQKHIHIHAMRLFLRYTLRYTYDMCGSQTPCCSSGTQKDTRNTYTHTMRLFSRYTLRYTYMVCADHKRLVAPESNDGKTHIPNLNPMIGKLIF